MKWLFYREWVKFKHKYIFVLLLLSLMIAKAENRSSYEGTHFLIGFMQNEIEITGSGLVLQLFITSSFNTEIKVRIPRQQEQKFRINPKQVFRLDLPSYIENRQSEVNLQVSVELISDFPISVYAFNSQYTTSDAYAAIPITQWGNEYVVMSMPNDQYKTQLDPWDLDSSYLIPRSSEFMVIAAYDNTTIEFQPKSITREGKQTFIKYNQNLNKGDCYLVQSYAATRGNGDLTGTIVKSNKPIGVLSGHVRTAIPQNEWPSNDKDHLCEMLMPTSAWGKEFVSVPFGTNPDGDLFRLTAIYDNTFITYRNPYGTHTIVLDAPGVSASIWDAFEPTVWRSNKPVQIGQFMRHKFGSDPDRNYDPCLVILPPVEQFVSRILFQTVGNTPNNPDQFFGHYIYIVAEQNAIPTLMLDGLYVKDTYPMIQVQNVPGTQYYWERISLDEGVHEIYCQDGKFSGVLYGTGLADSYGMTLGSSLNNPFIRDSIPPTLSVNEQCGKISGRVNETIDSISSGISFIYVNQDLTFNYSWQIDPYTDTSTSINFTAQPLDPASSGQFALEIYDKNNNKIEYKFFYKGLDLELPDSVNFGIVNVNDSSCITIPIINNSIDTVRIDSLVVANETRVKLRPGFPTPFLLIPGDTVYCDICFFPDSNLIPLSSDLILSFNCERIKSLPLLGTAESPNLTAIGYDFGLVRVGDTVCADVYVVNNGNLPVNLIGLSSMQFSEAFIFDTASIFPSLLRPGDSLKVNVCFTPDSIMNYLTVQSATNDRIIPNSIIVTGQGAAPQVNSIVVDWKGKRIQTRNDTTIYFINSGNYKCNLKFEKIIDSSSVFDTIPFFTIDNNLNPGDSIAVDCSFYPWDTISYHSNMQLVVDWKYHAPVSVELLGRGTIPQISTIDVAFDTTKIFSKRDTITAVIKSFGNEKLTIDSANYYSGDSSAFKIDYSLFRNLIINPLIGDSLFSLPIQFKPQSIGEKEMTIEVIHDAAPSFNRIKSYFKLSGPSVPEDTISLDINADLSGSFFPCINDTATIIIINDGNVNLILQSVTIQADSIEANLMDTINLPIIIPPDSLRKIQVRVLPNKNQTGKIKITAIFNDTNKIEKEFFVVPDKNPITIQNLDNLEVEPGDIISMELGGNITKPTEIPIDFEIQLSTKQKNLFLITENFDILIFNVKGVTKYIAKVKQDSDKIVIRCMEKLLIKEPCSWSVKFDLLVLLGYDLNYEVNAKAIAEPCYEPDSTEFKVELKNVCVFPLRHVKLVESPLHDVRILPNPVTDDLHLIFIMGDDDWVNFTVFDKLGKKCFESENLFLKKGIHSRIFEFSLFTEGIYFLTIQNQEMTKNILFIKYCY